MSTDTPITTFLLRIVTYAAIPVLFSFCISRTRSADPGASQAAQKPTRDTVVFKTVNPQPLPGINSTDIYQLVDILGSTALDKKTKDSCAFYTWAAYTDPLHFDKKHADMSIKTLRLQMDGKLDDEENPYLSEWSLSSEWEYFNEVMQIMLTYYHCQSYGDDTEGVGAALYQILQTRSIKIPKYKNDENVYQYLERINKTVLSKKNKIALISKGYFNIYVCDIPNKAKLIALMDKLKNPVVEPQ